MSKIPLFFSEQDFTPASLGNLQLWLDAGTIEQADGTAVTSWKDKVSGTNAFSMSTTAAQPILKTGILNGKPVVRFDGVDDYLDLTYPFDYKLYANNQGCVWSPDGTYFASAHATTSPYLVIYKRSGNSFVKLANPATLPTGGAQKLKFSPDGNYLAVPHSSSPYITVYKRSGDTFTKLTNPTTLPVGNANSVAWASDSKSFIVTSSAGTGSRVAVYSLDQLTDTLTYQSSGFSGGDVYSDVTLASNDTSLVFTYTNASPYVTLATYNKSTYQITSLSPTLPDIIPTGAGNGCSFSPDGTYLSVSHTTSPFVSVYFRSGTTYTKLANPTTLPANNGLQTSWSNDNQFVAVTHATSPFVSIYQKSGTGTSATLTKISNPATLPQNTGAGVAFSPAGGYLAVGNTTSGYLTMYTQSGSTFTAITKNDMLRNVGGSTMFVVAKPAYDSTNDNLLSISAGASTAYRSAIFATTSNKPQCAYRTLDSDTAVSLTASQTGASNVGTIIGAVIDNLTSNISIYVDGAFGGTGSGILTLGNTSNTNSNFIYIGKYTAAGFEYLGDIAEIIVYNRALSPSEIAQVNAYLTVKYFLTDPTKLANLMAWYDASTLTGTSGTAVSALLDKSGNEAHMYQSTTAAQPTLQTGVLNGKNVVRFDGVDDFMNLTAPFNTEPVGIPSLNANSFSNNGQYYTICGNSSVLLIYKKNGNIFEKLTGPSTMPAGTIYEQSWTSDDSYLAVASTASPRIIIYQRSGDTFTKLSDPAVLPSGSGYGCHFSNNNDYLAVGASTSPYIVIYKTDKTVTPWTFTKLANPATLPAGLIYSTKFSPDDTFLACAMNTSPYVHIYSRSGDTFTKISDPATLPTSTQNSISWLNSTTFAITGAQPAGNNFIYIYQFNGSKFELLTSIDIGATSATGLAYGRSKNYLAVSYGLSPRFKIYKVDGSTYTALPNPLSLPTGTGRGVAWGANDEFLGISHSTSPFCQMYKRDGDTFTNMNRLNMLRNVGGATVVQVVKYGGLVTEEVAMSVLGGTGTARTVLSRSTTGLFRQNGRALDADTNINNDSVQTATAGAFYIQSGVFDFTNANYNQYINGSLDKNKSGGTTAGNTSNTDSTQILIGYQAVASTYLSGDVADIYVFNRVLNATELSNLHQYLGRKWGITIA